MAKTKFILDSEILAEIFIAESKIFCEGWNKINKEIKKRKLQKES